MEARYLEKKDIDTAAWDALVAASPQGSIFCYSWYIDVIADGKWSGVVVYDGGNLQAVFPMMTKEKYFIKYAMQPRFTKYWGICFAPKTFGGAQKEYKWKKKVVDEIINKIPKIQAIDYSFHPSFDYPLPFYHNHFKLFTKYTFCIDFTVPIELIGNGFSESIKKNIEKAEKAGFSVEHILNIENIINVAGNEKGGERILPERFLPMYKALLSVCGEKDKCFGISIYTPAGECVASGCFLHDRDTTYYLSGYVKPSYRDSGASALLTWEGIKQSQKISKRFDFLGSMIENIEYFFRGFGARPLPYLSIEKAKFPFSLIK